MLRNDVKLVVILYAKTQVNQSKLKLIVHLFDYAALPSIRPSSYKITGIAQRNGPLRRSSQWFDDILTGTNGEGLTVKKPKQETPIATTVEETPIVAQPATNNEKEVPIVDAHNGKNEPIRIEQVIAVGLVGNKNFMQEKVIKEGDCDILRISGFANEHNTVKKTDQQGQPLNNNRPTTYIKGAFEATNLLTGAHYMSGQLILPDSISGFICASLDQHGPVTLDVTVRLERAEKSIVGYKFASLLHKIEPKNKPVAPVDTGV